MNTRFDLFQFVVPLAGLGIWKRSFKKGENYWSETVRDILEVGADAVLPFEEIALFYKDWRLIHDFVQRRIASTFTS